MVEIIAFPTRADARHAPAERPRETPARGRRPAGGGIDLVRYELPPARTGTPPPPAAQPRAVALLLTVLLLWIAGVIALALLVLAAILTGGWALILAGWAIVALGFRALARDVARAIRRDREIGR